MRSVKLVLLKDLVTGMRIIKTGNWNMCGITIKDTEILQENGYINIYWNTPVQTLTAQVELVEDQKLIQVPWSFIT